jgi:hypothetical protein
MPAVRPRVAFCRPTRSGAGILTRAIAMPNARILFVVPADASAIADILADTSCEVDGRENPEFDELVAHLAAAAGGTVEIDFDEPDDPLSPIWDLARTLDGTGSRYWAVSDAFVERSRSLRTTGRILLNLDGGSRIDLKVPWEHGEPALDAATLEAAGMDRAEADAVAESFRTGAPTNASPPPRG